MNYNEYRSLYNEIYSKLNSIVEDYQYSISLAYSKRLFINDIANYESYLLYKYHHLDDISLVIRDVLSDIGKSVKCMTYYDVYSHYIKSRQ